MNDRNSLRDAGENGKIKGMELAANRRPDRVTQGKIAMLTALLSSPDGTATIDDATADLTEQFNDGGKWRGSVCRTLAMAKLIERVAIVKSDRPSRHGGHVTCWRVVDRGRAQLALSRLLAAQDCHIGVAADMPDESSPINKEAAPGHVVRDAPGTASHQKTFPTFDQRQTGEKGFSHGQTD